MALSNADRQRRSRARRQDQRPVIHYRRPQDRRPRPQRWAEAVETLRQLQAEYQEWLDNLPEALQDAPVAEKLEAICALDLDELDVELPRGFGRD
jgi:hypothetical protein